MTARPPHPTEAIVGRESELARVRAAFDDARAGHGRCVLLSGDAGIGKTYTAEAIAAHAHAEHARVAWGRCVEAEGAPAYWPWVQLLRVFSADGRGADETTGVELGALADSLRRRAPGGSGHALDSADTRFTFFDLVTEVLRAAARQNPQVLILEDLHAADADSLRLLQFAVRELRGTATLLVGTVRTTVAPGDGVWSETLAELLRVPGTEVVALSGWCESDVARFVALRTGHELPADAVSALHRRTDGNPLFVSEYVQLLSAEHRLDGTTAAAAFDDTLPDTIRAVMSRRLAPLSTGTQALLALAATMGREFRLDVLRAASEQHRDPFEEALQEAVRHGIVTDEATNPGHMRFVHALMADAVTDALDAGQTTALHQRIGAAMERLPNAQALLPELAHHFSAGGDSGRAVHHARAAGDRALTLFAYDEAERLYQLALDHLAHDPGALRAEACALLLALGETRNVSGDRERARETFRQAASAARGLRADGTPDAAELLAQAALGFTGGWTGAGEVAKFDPARASVFDAEAANLLEEALEALGNADSARHACLRARLAVELHFRAPLAQRDALTQEAADMARRLQDPVALAYVLSLRHATVWSAGNAEERLAMTAEIIAAAQLAGDRTLTAAGHAWRMTDCLELGQLAEMEREAARLSALVAELRQPFLQWTSGVYQAMRALVAGRFAEAEVAIRGARDVGQRGRTWAEIYYSLQMTALRREQGRTASLQRVADFLKAAVDQYPTLLSLRTQLAFLLLELDRRDAARREVDYLAANDFADIPDDMNWMTSITEAAEVCSALADTSRAERLYGLLTPFADRFAVGLGGATCWGSVARTLGLLATTLSQWHEATVHFDAALEANRRLGSRVWVAHTQHAYGAMLRARNADGDAEQAHYLLDQALVNARAVGMQRLESKVAALLEEVLPASTHVLPPAPSARSDAVFRREGDFWTIDFDGRVMRLKALRGAGYLVHLLRHPGREFHVTELVTLERDPQTALTASSVAIEADASIANNLGDAGARLDRQAIAAYQEQLRELREELAESEANHDVGRTAQLRQTLEFLMQELGNAARGRKAASHAERARVLVTKGLKKTLQRIRDGHPSLGRHLEATVKSGYFCSYVPDPRVPVRWDT